MPLQITVQRAFMESHQQLDSCRVLDIPGIAIIDFSEKIMDLWVLRPAKLRHDPFFLVAFKLHIFGHGHALVQIE